MFLLHRVLLAFTLISVILPTQGTPSTRNGQNKLTTLGSVKELRTTKAATDIASGDFDDDGLHDFATIGGRQLQIFYQRKARDGWKSTSLKLASSILQISVARLNRDRLSDIVVMTAEPPTLHSIISRPKERHTRFWQKAIPEIGRAHV